MRLDRCIWSAGLLLGLAGCAGARQGVVSEPPTVGERAAPKLLFWRGRAAAPAAETKAPATADAAAAGVAPADDKAGATAGASPRSAKAPLFRGDQVTQRVARFFPMMNRGDGGGPSAKSPLVHPAEGDIWADSARQGVQARLDRWRQNQRGAEGGTAGETSVLPVAMEIGPGRASVRPRPVAEAVASRRPPAPPAEVAEPEVVPASAPAPAPHAPLTLPDPVEAARAPAPADGVERTSARVAESPEPEAPLTDPVPAPEPPLGDTPPLDLASAPASAAGPAPAPAPAPAPTPAPEPAPTPTPAPAAAPETGSAPPPDRPAPAEETPAPAPPATGNAPPPARPAPAEVPIPGLSTPAPKTASVKPTAPPPPDRPAPAPAPAAEAPAPNADDPGAAPRPARPAPPEAPSAETSTPAAPAVKPDARPSPTPAPTPTAPEPPRAAATPTAQSAPPTGPVKETAGATGKKNRAHRFLSALTHRKARPASRAQGGPLPAPPLPTKQMPGPVVAGSDARPAPHPADLAGRPRRATAAPGPAPIANLIVSGPLFPATYYVNPGPAPYYAQRRPAAAPAPRGADPDTRLASTGDRGPAAAAPRPAGAPTGPTRAKVKAPAPAPRRSLLSRLADRLQGVEEVESHPDGCDCGKHPRSAGDPGPSVPVESGDVAEGGQRVHPVAAQFFQEPPQR